FVQLALGQIANESREETAAARGHLADGEFHREGRTVLALTYHDAADADDPPFASFEILPNVSVVPLTIRRRHEHANIALNHFLRGETEQALRRRAVGFDKTAIVDHDDRIGRSLQDGLQARFPFLEHALDHRPTGLAFFAVVHVTIHRCRGRKSAFGW